MQENSKQKTRKERMKICLFRHTSTGILPTMIQVQRLFGDGRKPDLDLAAYVVQTSPRLKYCNAISLGGKRQ